MCSVEDKDLGVKLNKLNVIQTMIVSIKALMGYRNFTRQITEFIFALAGTSPTLNKSYLFYSHTTTVFIDLSVYLPLFSH